MKERVAHARREEKRSFPGLKTAKTKFRPAVPGDAGAAGALVLLGTDREWCNRSARPE